MLCISILIAFSLACMIIHVFDMCGLFLSNSIILSHVLGVPEVVSLICQHSMYLWINIDMQPLCEWSSSYAEAKNYPFGYGKAELIRRPALAHTLQVFSICLLRNNTKKLKEMSSSQAVRKCETGL